MFPVSCQMDLFNKWDIKHVIIQYMILLNGLMLNILALKSFVDDNQHFELHLHLNPTANQYSFCRNGVTRLY